MAFYDRKEWLRDGRVLIYTTAGAKSAVWQMRLNVRGVTGYITKSTKTRNLGEAARVAEDEFDRLQARIREGAPIKDWTFDRHWKDWHKRNIEKGAWKKERAYWHEKYYNRYFSAYFGGKALNDITAEYMEGYWSWRNAYWQSGEGAKIRKDDAQRRNSKKRPAAKTLKMEQSALRQIFGDAHNLRRMKYLATIKAETQRESGRRATFDREEYRALYRKLGHYVKCWAQFKDDRVHEGHLRQREQLRRYVLFLANTGLRVGEANDLRWEDLTEFEDTDKKTKLRIYVRETGKTGQRIVIGQARAVKYTRLWKQISEFTDKQDYVFYGQGRDENGRGKKHTNLNKTFRTLLQRIEYKERDGGLLYDADGKIRSLYSLRHYYATARLLLGEVSIHDLALNMGTSVKQIERHYSHVLIEQRSAEITRIVDKEKDSARKTAFKAIMEAADEGDADLAHALVNTLVRAKV